MNLSTSVCKTVSRMCPASWKHGNLVFLRRGCASVVFAHPSAELMRLNHAEEGMTVSQIQKKN